MIGCVVRVWAERLCIEGDLECIERVHEPADRPNAGG